MAQERAAYLAAGVRERTPKGRDWANGHYVRDLGTEGGLIRALRVPRVRGGFQSRVLPRYRRRRAVVDRTLRDCFLAGVSTRRVGPCMKGLLGEAVSASTVSRVCTALSRDVAAFHDRPLSDHYRYVFLDALGSKVRGAPRSRRKVLLCAMGITLKGRRELIDFRLANSESEARGQSSSTTSTTAGFWVTPFASSSPTATRGCWRRLRWSTLSHPISGVGFTRCKTSSTRSESATARRWCRARKESTKPTVAGRQSPPFGGGPSGGGGMNPRRCSASRATSRRCWPTSKSRPPFGSPCAR